MRLIEKRGKAPRIILEKAEVRRMLESSYLLRRMGLMLERDDLVELAARVKLQVEQLAPEWQVDSETGELQKVAAEKQPPTK